MRRKGFTVSVKVLFFFIETGRGPLAAGALTAPDEQARQEVGDEKNSLSLANFLYLLVLHELLHATSFFYGTLICVHGVVSRFDCSLFLCTLNIGVGGVLCHATTGVLCVT